MPAATVISVAALGVVTRAWVYGDPEGQPIVLVHGFRGDHHGLEKIALELAERLPRAAVIVPDLPGFGETPAVPGREHTIDLYGEWLGEFITELAPEGTQLLLGHSFGSIVVANALQQGLGPERVVLVNPISAPALEGPKALLTRLSSFYYRAAERLPERTSRALLSNPLIVRGMSEVMAKTRDMSLRGWIHGQHAAYFSQFSDATTLLEAYNASISHTVAEYAEAFTAPTLLIAGERDDITPLAKQLDLQRSIPGSELRILQGTGHLVHYEAAEDAAGYIEAFLAKPSATSVTKRSSTRRRRAAGERGA